MPFSRLVPRLASYCVAAAILFLGVVISLERGRVKDLDDYKNPRYTTGRASLAEYLKEFESAFEADLCPDLIPRSYSALLGESPNSRCMRLEFEVPVFDGIAFVDFRT